MSSVFKMSCSFAALLFCSITSAQEANLMRHNTTHVKADSEASRFGVSVLKASNSVGSIDAGPPVSAPLVSVEALLKNAAVAVREKSYKGRFTYEFGSVLETLEIVHSVEDGLERERILHLSGRKREFLRAGRRNDCMSVGALLLRGNAFARNGQLQKLDQNYHFYIGADERVAGRAASMVQIVPKDEYRYGMTMAFDKQSGLPLLSLTGTKNTNIERFQFVDMAVGDVIVEADLQPTSGPYKNLSLNTANCTGSGAEPGVDSLVWNAAWVPQGFVLSQGGREPGYDEVLTYSDGLTSFTVFIKGLKGDAVKSFKSGVARRGATLVLLNAASFNAKDYGVILVGEVPIAAAKKVIGSIVLN